MFLPGKNCDRNNYYQITSLHRNTCMISFEWYVTFLPKRFSRNPPQNGKKHIQEEFQFGFAQIFCFERPDFSGQITAT